MKIDLKGLSYLELQCSARTRCHSNPITEDFTRALVKRTNGSWWYKINILLKMEVLERKILKKSTKVKLKLESLWVPTAGAFEEVIDSRIVYIKESFTLRDLFEEAFDAFDDDDEWGYECTKVILPNYSERYYFNFKFETLQYVTKFSKLMEKAVEQKMFAQSGLSTSIMIKEYEFQNDIILQDRQFAFDAYQNQLNRENDLQCASIGGGSDGGSGKMIAMALINPKAAKAMISW